MAYKIPTIFKSLLMVFLVSFSSIAFSAPRIVGGADTVPGDYPWMASLQVKSSGEHICGGTLVDEKWVLSAKHCFDQYVSSDLVIVVGEYNLSDTDETDQDSDPSLDQVSVDIATIYPHARDDLIMIQLAEPVLHVTPISLATQEHLDDIATDELLTVLGWGNRNADQEIEKDFPDVLQEVDVPLFDQDMCRDNWKGGEFISNSMLCAGFVEGGQGSCRGDSGGPLMNQWNGQWYQLGVSSFGAKQCAYGPLPSVYISIVALRDFITSVIDNTPEPPEEYEFFWSHNSPYTLFSEVGSSKEYQFRMFNKLDRNLTINSFSFLDGVSSGFGDVSVENSDSCSKEVIAPHMLGECSYSFTTKFSTVGDKHGRLSFVTDATEFPQVWSQISIDSVQEASFNDYVGESLDLLVSSQSDWQHEFGSLELVDDQDDDNHVFVYIGSTSELTTELRNQTQVSLYGYVEGSGSLSFNWLLENPDTMDFELYLDGKLYAANSPDNISRGYVSESIYFSEASQHSIEWRVRRPDDWVDKGVAIYPLAKLQSIRFDADAVEEEKKKKSSSGGGSVDYLAILFLLFFARLSIFKVFRKFS